MMMMTFRNKHSLAITIALFASFSSTDAFQPIALKKRTTNTFQLSTPFPTTLSTTTRTTTAASTKIYYSGRDADMIEMMVGGQRYEMVELPDSMIDTTLFVGNLCEFVTDDMLSCLFQEVSVLRHVPACVARKANASSLKYGFVTFPTLEEKEAAIIRFSGYELNGRPMKVEEIKDFKKRVRVPEKLVVYTVGELKKTRDGSKNTMRMASSSSKHRHTATSGGANGHHNSNHHSNNSGSKRKGRNKHDVHYRLNGFEMSVFERSASNGYLTLEGTGYRRGRRASPLANAHRQWCDSKEMPQVILCKASGGRSLDNVIVDLSPLRIGALSEDIEVVDQFLTKWKAAILIAAERSGMSLNPNYVEDNCERIPLLDIDDGDDDEDEDCVEDGYADEVCSIMEANENRFDLNIQEWDASPISKLPCISMGVFEGKRSKARAMAKELAMVWNLMDPNVHLGSISYIEAGSATKVKNRRKNGTGSGGGGGGRNEGREKTKGLREYRKGRRERRYR